MAAHAYPRLDAADTSAAPISTRLAPLPAAAAAAEIPASVDFRFCGPAAMPLNREEAAAITRAVAHPSIETWYPLAAHGYNTMDAPSGAVVKLRADAPLQYDPFLANWLAGSSLTQIKSSKLEGVDIDMVYLADVERRQRLAAATPELVSDPISLLNRDPDTGNDRPDGSSHWCAELSSGDGHQCGMFFTSEQTDDGEIKTYYLFCHTAPRAIGEELMEQLDAAVVNKETVHGFFSRPVWKRACEQAERERARMLLVAADALDLLIARVPDMHAPMGSNAMLAQTVASCTGNLVLPERDTPLGKKPKHYYYYSNCAPTDTLRGGALVIGGPLQGIELLRGKGGHGWGTQTAGAIALSSGARMSLQSVSPANFAIDSIAAERRKRLGAIYQWGGVQGYQSHFHPHNFNNLGPGDQESQAAAGYRAEWGRLVLRPAMVQLTGTRDSVRLYNP